LDMEILTIGGPRKNDLLRGKKSIRGGNRVGRMAINQRAIQPVVAQVKKKKYRQKGEPRQHDTERGGQRKAGAYLRKERRGLLF